MHPVKKITYSTLHNCKVDYITLDRLFDGHSNIATKKHILEQVTVLYSAESRLHYKIQLIINSLQHLGILVYVDDNDAPCDTTAQLFDDETLNINIINTNVETLDVDDYEDAEYVEPEGEEDEDVEISIDELIDSL